MSADGPAQAKTTLPAPAASAGVGAKRPDPCVIVMFGAGGDLAAYTPSELGLASQSELNRVSDRTDKALTGVAMAFAMAGAPTLLQSETFAMTGNWGTFEGENGLAVNAAVRLAKNVQLNGGVTYGLNENLAGGRVGVQVGW